jgi:hypothetical protein
MKRTILVIALVALVGLGGQAFAELDTVDAVPAATLLIPYFQVDVSDDACANSTGLTTLFSVNNASAAPTLAHVTVWTDWSVPALDFDIYLTGYDVQTLNVRDFFCSGNLPTTGFAVSNQGAFSDPNVPFPSCNNGTSTGSNPVWGAGAISQNFRNHLKAWFTGNQSPVTGDCAGSGDGGSDLAVGYITVDQTLDCSALFPSDAGYFDGGIAGFDNILWGDYFLVDEAGNFSQGFSAVHIEAADTANAFQAGEHTFYGRYVAATAIDQREALPTTTAARFAAGGQFDGTTFYIWREGNNSTSSVACGGAPGWWPLGTSNTSGGGAITIFDEQENPITVTQGPSGEPVPGAPVPPNETQAWAVGPGQAGNAYDTGSFNFGWVYQNLQHSDTVYGDNNAQQWTIWTLSASGRFSVGLDAIQLDNANNAIVNNPGV